jgi:TetR/AcrR family transcriptional regulator, transcriptional repressor for nem operon
LTGIDTHRNLSDMRYPAEQKAETHARIIETAANSFREHGADGNGIGPVMKELGLTKGGFYRHFDSKDDLIAEAICYAFEQRGASMVATAEAAPTGQGLRAIIEAYLTRSHLSHPSIGCVFFTLGPELARQPKAVRKRINQAVAAYRERLLPFVPGKTQKDKQKNFGILFPGMAGVMVVARAIDDVETQERMLSAAREFFINSFAEQRA